MLLTEKKLAGEMSVKLKVVKNIWVGYLKTYYVSALT